jgi:hypothetical protein
VTRTSMWHSQQRKGPGQQTARMQPAHTQPASFVSNQQEPVIPSERGGFFLPRSVPLNASARAVEESLFDLRSPRPPRCPAFRYLQAWSNLSLPVTAFSAAHSPAGGPPLVFKGGSFFWVLNLLGFEPGYFSPSPVPRRRPNRVEPHRSQKGTPPASY